MKIRTATKKDFKIGQTLIDSDNNEFTISSHYDDGVWEARGDKGSKCVFENEAKFYKIKKENKNEH